MSLGCPRCGSLITDAHKARCPLACDAPDNLTDAIVRVIDGWRSRNPELTYFETVTVIEGIARMLRKLRDDADTVS